MSPLRNPWLVAFLVGGLLGACATYEPSDLAPGTGDAGETGSSGGDASSGGAGATSSAGKGGLAGAGKSGGGNAGTGGGGSAAGGKGGAAGAAGLGGAGKGGAGGASGQGAGGASGQGAGGASGQGGGGSGGAATCMTDSPDASCSCTVYDDHDYWFCLTNLTFAAAEAKCTAVGMHLPKIETNTEDAWLFAACQGKAMGEYFLGSSDASTPDSWSWLAGGKFWEGVADGTASGYENWNTGEPNASGDCVVVQSNAVWDDRTCTDQRKYVCEAP